MQHMGDGWKGMTLRKLDKRFDEKGRGQKAKWMRTNYL